jgi:hypothetical protein
MLPDTDYPPFTGRWKVFSHYAASETRIIFRNPEPERIRREKSGQGVSGANSLLKSKCGPERRDKEGSG